MRTAPSKPYVYQPFGSVSHPEHKSAGRLWGVGGLGELTEIKGLTKEEAAAIARILTPDGGEK